MSQAPPSQTELLQTIARQADVSISTVTRVLNGDTRGAYPKIARRNERIRKLADAMNYRPTWRGRTFQGGKTQMVALLHDRELLLGGVYSDLIRGAIERFQEDDYHLTTWRLRRADRERTDLLLDRRFDAVLVHHELSGSVREAIERAGLPAVVLNTAETDGLPYVVPDDRGGAERLAGHLLESGHRQFVYVASGTHYSAKQRLSAFVERVRGARAKCRILEWPYLESELTPKLLSDLQGATAAVFHVSHHALWATRTLRHQGAKLPADLSLATFTCGDRAKDAVPMLTSVEVPFVEMGRLGAAMLLEAINDPDASLTDRVLPTQLIVRESTVSRASS